MRQRSLDLCTIVLVSIITSSCVSCILSDSHSLRECGDLASSSWKIDCFLSLEKSIVCDQNNIQRLIEVFFPVNSNQPQLVRVHYYMKTNTIAHTDDTAPLIVYNDTIKADYEFIWLSSSILIYINAKVLEGMSLYSYTAESNDVYIILPSFKYPGNKKWAEKLLNEATTWVR